MADSSVSVTSGSGNNIDTRTESTNGNHRQVVVLGDPSVNDNVVSAVTADPGPSSTIPGLVFRLAGSASVQVVGISASIGVYFDGSNPSVNVGNPTIAGISSSIGVYFDRANPSVTIAGFSSSVGVYFDRSNPSVNVGSPTLTGITNTVGVYFDRANPSVNIGTPTLAGITGSVGVYFDRSNPSVNVGSPTLTGITNTVGVYFDRANPSVNIGSPTLAGITSSIGVYFDRAKPSVLADISATASIFTVSGSTSTAGNNTLVAPSASYNFKVFAYSIQTTGVVSMAPRFTTGASAGATELWRPLVTAAASSSAPVGANLAVPPPGFIFATGTSTTLALYLDVGSLVHYSVSYIKESA